MDSVLTKLYVVPTREKESCSITYILIGCSGDKNVLTPELIYCYYAKKQRVLKDKFI